MNLSLLGLVKTFAFPSIIAVSAVAALFGFWLRAKEDDREFEDVVDIFVASLCGSVIGGRVFEVIFSAGRFLGEPLSVFTFWSHPGFSTWGAVFGALASSYYLLRKKRLSVLKFFDYFTFGIGLALPLTFIGHVVSGTYYGMETSWLWGVSTPLALERRHPTAILGFIAFSAIFLVLFKLSRRSHAPGFLFFLTFSLFSAAYFSLELLRGDNFSYDRKLLNLVMALLAFLLFSTLFYIRLKRSLLDDLSLVIGSSGLFIRGAGKALASVLPKRQRVPHLRRR